MHDRNVKFYKYLSPEACLAVLNNKMLKWSNPNLFNDPFDMPFVFNFSFNGKELSDALLEEMVTLSYGPDEPIGDYEHKFFAQAMKLRKMKNKPSEEKFRKDFANTEKENELRLRANLNELRAFYRSFRDHLAIFCISKKHDDLLMWAHYAQNHTGCVFKFCCIPEKNRPLCMAREVSYQEAYPMRANLKDYVKHLTGQQELISDEELYKVFAYTKSEHWKYEEEWRCVTLLRDRKSGFDFDPMIPEELEAVYLGCRIHDNTKSQILTILTTHFPNTHVYQANTCNKYYKLVFEKIN